MFQVIPFYTLLEYARIYLASHTTKRFQLGGIKKQHEFTELRARCLTKPKRQR